MKVIGNSKNVNDYIITIFCGTISTIIIGFLFFGFSIFNKQNPSFQFPVFGIIGTISFALFKLKEFRYSIFILSLLFLFEIIFTGEKYIVTHILFYIAMVLSILIYTKFFYARLNNIKYSRFLVLASIISISYVIVTIILGLLFKSDSINLFLFQNMPIGFLIGIGLGLGFELSEYMLAIIKNN
ncbi:MAG: hypothetical protein GWP19_06855 [Planctomycetia bacterium]|nr:hypothetical protein [Planctomycetia bacterium]